MNERSLIPSGLETLNGSTSSARTVPAKAPVEVIYVPFVATVNDTPCFPGTAPASYRIIDARVRLTTGNGSEVGTLRSASGGGGTAHLDSFNLATVKPNIAPSVDASPYTDGIVEKGGQVYFRRNTTVGIGTIELLVSRF